MSLDFRVPVQQTTQVVKINNKLSQAKHNSTGAPQECVSSPLLYSLYTNECISHSDSVKMITSADDTTLIGLISGDDDSAYRNDWMVVRDFIDLYRLPEGSRSNRW